MVKSMERQNWIDVARGIGILCVVAGHWVLDDVYGAGLYTFCNLLYAFHVPLFFVLSGFLCRRTFSRRTVFAKLDSIMVPYLLYTFIVMAVLWLCRGLDTEQLKMCIWNAVAFNGVYVTWFFPSLFAAELIGIYVVSHTHRLGGVLSCIVLAMIVGVIVNSDCMRHYVPMVFKSRTVPIAVVFWLTGWVLQKTEIFKESWPKWVHFIVMMACVMGLCSRIGYRSDFAKAMLGNPIVYYLAAFSGIMLVMLVSRRIESNRFLEWCGRHSIIILISHCMAPSQTLALGGRNGIQCLLYDIVITLLLCFVFSHAGPVFDGRGNLFRHLVKDE